MTSQGLAVVTGASAGIGAAIAQGLHETGRPVLMLARRHEKVARLHLENAMYAAVDVRDGEAVRAAIHDAVERHGEVETMVHNAGVMPLGDIKDQSIDEWRLTMEVNLIAVADLTQAVLPGMVRRGQGTVVVVSSLAARQVFAHHAAYCASKAAVHALADALRLEAGGHGVRVIEISPGMVDTQLVESTTSQKIREEHEAERFHVLDPAMVAQTVVWACGLPEDVCVRELHVAHTNQL